MWRWGIFQLVALAACTAVSSGAYAERRVALVIGNSGYRHTPELTNPRNDAVDIAMELKRLGFEVVVGIDLDKAAMDRTIRDFAGKLRAADTGLFFYAGHGLQVGGVNYLVPIDAQLSTEAALDFEMVRLDLVQRTMERESKTNVLFLDACRDNPLTRNLARAMGTRGGTRGLTIGHGLAAAESGVGTLISYSTQPGNVALDGDGRNSPFSGALVKRIATPRDDLSTVLINVRRAVMEATRNQQVPWEHSALTGRFYFARPPEEKHGRVFRDCEETDAAGNFICPEMVVVPAGDYEMGADADELAGITRDGQPVTSQSPKHKVTISRPFAIGKFEISVSQFDAFIKATGHPHLAACWDVRAGVWVQNRSFRNPGYEQSSKHPATCTSWNDAIAYAKWLAAKTNKAYRLPSEAEWEYAARAGTTTQYWFGDDAGNACPFENLLDNRALKGMAIFSDNCDNPFDYAAPIGFLRANAFGIYDILGNAAEWVQDVWHDNYVDAPGAGISWEKGDATRRVVRGGSWIDPASFVRSSGREDAKPDVRQNNYGIRVARTMASGP